MKEAREKLVKRTMPLGRWERSCLTRSIIIRGRPPGQPRAMYRLAASRSWENILAGPGGRLTPIGTLMELRGIFNPAPRRFRAIHLACPGNFTYGVRLRGGSSDIEGLRRGPGECTSEFEELASELTEWLVFDHLVGL